MTDVLDVLPTAKPGGWQAQHREDAPGTALDGQPWARSWASYLRAVNDPKDGSARTFIANAAAAMGERVGSEGGFLVPEILRAQVLAYMTPAIVRPRAQVLPMSSLRLPVLTLDNPTQASGTQVLGGLTFSFAEEGAAIANTTPAFGRIVLEARKLAALCTAPNELADDAAGAWGDFLARVIAMGLAWTEDDYFIGTNGTGVSCPQGLVNAPCAVQVTRATSSVVSLADVAKMVNALHPASLQAGLTPGITDVLWLVSASAFTSLLEMYLAIGTASNTAAAGIDWLSLGDGQDVGPSMLGLPLAVTDHQPAVGTLGDVILADLRHYVIGDRQVMQVERSWKGAQFIDDNSYFRVRSRVDGRYWVQSATTTSAAQQVSPVTVPEVRGPGCLRSAGRAGRGSRRIWRGARTAGHGRGLEEMPKITADGPSYAEGHAPGDGEEHVHPGTGEPAEGADGTPSPEISNDAPDGAPEPEQVTQDSPAPPPSAPPRRIAPPEPPGE